MNFVKMWRNDIPRGSNICVASCSCMLVDVISISTLSYTMWTDYKYIKDWASNEIISRNIKKKHEARGQRSFQITRYGDA